MTSNTICRLDWDDITFSECKRRITLLKAYPIVREIELRASAMSGFHIILSCDNVNPKRVLYLRRIWKDDGNRLVKDVLDSGYHRDVMFRYKVIAGFTWYEEPICTYTRINHSNQWKTRRHSHQLAELEPLLS